MTSLEIKILKNCILHLPYSAQEIQKVGTALLYSHAFTLRLGSNKKRNYINLGKWKKKDEKVPI